MPYCKNCGCELTANAKYCQKCGCAVASSSNTEYKNASREEFSGKIYKCPNCGEILKAFEINCPACGYELRGTKATGAVKEFALKLEAIEARRMYDIPYGSNREKKEYVSNTDEQKISLIKSFSIPNTKEDMLEFMILATSCLNYSAYDYFISDQFTKGEKAVNAAWLSKVQQIYEKARRSYSTDSIFSEIEILYNKCEVEIKKSKKNGIVKFACAFGWIPLSFVLLIFFASFGDGGAANEAAEIDRLERIVVDVQDALEDGEYVLALQTADSIDYQRYDSEMERKWDIQRTYWVDKVIRQAAENNIELEYTPSKDVDNANH